MSAVGTPSAYRKMIGDLVLMLKTKAKPRGVQPKRPSDDNLGADASKKMRTASASVAVPAAAAALEDPMAALLTAFREIFHSSPHRAMGSQRLERAGALLYFLLLGPLASKNKSERFLV